MEAVVPDWGGEIEGIWGKRMRTEVYLRGSMKIQYSGNSETHEGNPNEVSK